MKIIQTFWTKPVENNYERLKFKPESFGWNSKKYSYMGWALSCLRLRMFYSNVELITDTYGKYLLIDILNLPYTKVSTVLDQLNDINPKFWSISKIYSYSIQDTPFIHVDGDVFIWEKFSKKIQDSKLIAQNFDFNQPLYIKTIKELEKLGVLLPKDTLTSIKEDLISINAGILGGNDISFIKTYANTAFNFLTQNHSKLLKLKDAEATNIIFEQYFFYKLALNKKIPISTHSSKYEYGDVPTSYVECWGVPVKTKYIHPISKLKKFAFVENFVEMRLRMEFPEVYYDIEDRINNLDI